MNRPLIKALPLFLVLSVACAQAKVDKKESDPTKTDTDMVWVGQSDEAKSCAKEKGISLDAMAAKLTSANVHISAKKKIRDHRPRIQMCGADLGNQNGFLISKKDLEKASTLGFKPVTNEQK